MEIKGLDYNTQREKLVMSEYGREIQKMVDVAVALPTKSERTRCARTIIRQMENKNPMLRTTPNYEQTLWDHLYLMSHKQLDIDWPYDVGEAEKILTKPQPMKLPGDNKSYSRHYGRLLSNIFERLKTMPAGAARDELVRYTANQMKRDLAAWGHGTLDDEKVADDLAYYTDGAIQIDLSTFRFDRKQPAGGNDNKRNKRKRG